MLLKASGRFVVVPGDARINLDDDFCRYYRKLVLDYYMESPLELQLPKYGAHITVVSKKIHRGVDTSRIDYYHNTVVAFEYDNNILKGGTRFTTYYARVECFFAEFIKRKLGVVEDESFLGLHICVCNNKLIWKNLNNYKTTDSS